MFICVDHVIRANLVVFSALSLTLTAAVCDGLERAGIAARVEGEGVHVPAEEAWRARQYLASMIGLS
jgi:hypothetical protein